MKNAFNPNNRQWDSYKTFYSERDNFVSFETGETMFTGWTIKPHHRKYYEAHDVYLLSTADDRIKAFYDKDGNKIPRAHLTWNGLQNVLVEKATGRTVALMHNYNNNHLPEKLRNCKAYALSDRAPIQGMGTIAQFKPYKMTPEDKEWLNTAVVAAKCLNKGDRYWGSYTHDAAWFKKPVTEFIKNLSEDKSRCFYLAEGQFDIGREVIEHEFLTVEVA